MKAPDFRSRQIDLAKNVRTGINFVACDDVDGHLKTLNIRHNLEE